MRTPITTTLCLLFFLFLFPTTTITTTLPRSTTAEPPSTSPSTASTLDPHQLRALQYLHIPTIHDPCTTTTSTTTCDNATPFRHLLSLRLTDCPSDHRLSTATLSTLSTLTSITFFNCHTPLIHFPSSLTNNLHSFTSINSLQRLTGVFLSHLHNLTHLYISNDPIKASGIHIITSNMRNLKTITLYNTHLIGYLPKYWNPKLTHIDFSKNKLKGTIPISLTLLKNLKVLNFSSNDLNGVLPNSLGSLTSLKMLSLSSNSISGPIPGSISSISGLVHLDLGSNQLNGVIPEFISEMRELKYLNLENNKLHGVLPFNASFIKKLDVFKINGNYDLCYNHSIILENMNLGIARCDKHGMPILPPPAVGTQSSWVDVGGGCSLQGDVKFAEVLGQMGAEVTWTENSVTLRGPPRDASGGKHLRAVDVNMNKMPDVAMTLAVVALYADGPTAIRDVASWRVKETERMIAICTELRKLGATVEEGPDYCVITPPERLNVAAIDTYDDHRMAMAFSLAACADVPVTIKDPACTRKTFPDYFDVLQKFTKH